MPSVVFRLVAFLRSGQQKQKHPQQTSQRFLTSERELEVHGGGRIVEHRQQILLHVPHRGGVFCQRIQHETDVVGVQLFQPTAYHLSRLVIPGDPQHLAFGETGRVKNRRNDKSLIEKCAKEWYNPL